MLILSPFVAMLFLPFNDKLRRKYNLKRRSFKPKEDACTKKLAVVGFFFKEGGGGGVYQPSFECFPI